MRLFSGQLFVRKPILTFVIFTAIVFLHPAWNGNCGEDEAKSEEEKQIDEKIQKFSDQIKSLQESLEAPEKYKEFRKVIEEHNKFLRNKDKEEQNFNSRENDLINLKDVREWLQKIYDLQSDLSRLYSEKYSIYRKKGSEICKARHKALAKFAAGELPGLKKNGFGVLNYPQMDGSTSTLPLAVMIACKSLGAEYVWESRSNMNTRATGYPVGANSLSYSLSDRPEKEYYLFEYTLQADMKKPVQERLAIIINKLLANNSSTHQSYVNIIEGRSDIGLLARKPSPDEVKLMQEKKVELEVTPCAIDAFVFLENTENPVNDLTVEQIRSIFTGKITNWKELGGPDKEISPYQREENSGSQELMKELVMKDIPMSAPGRDLISFSMIGPYVALTDDSDGISYSVYYYQQFMAGSPKTKLIAINGVEPNYENIKTRKYPLTSDVYIILRKGMSKDSSAMKLHDWILSPEGQSVVRESGYVTISSSDNKPN